MAKKRLPRLGHELPRGFQHKIRVHMAYDEGLAERIRGILRDRRDVSEKKMFGGIAFIVRGHMSVGIVKDDLMVRVGPKTYEDLVRHPHPRPSTSTHTPI